MNDNQSRSIRVVFPGVWYSVDNKIPQPTNALTGASNNTLKTIEDTLLEINNILKEIECRLNMLEKKS